MKIPVAKPYLTREEEVAVAETIRSGWVTQGPRVAEFEKIFAEYVGAKYAVAVTSATTALFLSLYMLDVGPEDEVIVPSFSFIATANVVVQVGAKPVFADINPRTFNIDPVDVEKKITKKTKVIIPVDQVGLPYDHVAINRVARRHKLHIVEDAACAIGSEYKGRKIGSINRLSCFSFHPRKVITTGDGGMIATSSKKFFDMARLLRHHGMGISDTARHGSNKVTFENYPAIGFNLRMTDIQAAVGIKQMEKLPLILTKRARLADRYTRVFQKSENIVPPQVPASCVPNWQSYVVWLRKNRKITRDELMQRLADRGISTRRGNMAAHVEKPYRKMYPKLRLPHTEEALAETITLPLYPAMTFKQQDFVIEEINRLTG